MQSPPEDSDDFHLIGVRVIKQYPSGELEFSMEKIPEEVLVIMVRDRLLPILSIEEAEGLGREFTLVDGFASRFDSDSLLSLLQDSTDSLV